MDDEVRRLVADLFETMDAAKGVGLAANQVGVARRVAVVDADGDRFAMIDPVIVEAEGRCTAEEGCLSIPEIYGDVTRPERVVLEATGPGGEPLPEGGDRPQGPRHPARDRSPRRHPLPRPPEPASSGRCSSPAGAGSTRTTPATPRRSRRRLPGRSDADRLLRDPGVRGPVAAGAAARALHRGRRGHPAGQPQAGPAPSWSRPPSSRGPAARNSGAPAGAPRRRSSSSPASGGSSPTSASWWRTGTSPARRAPALPRGMINVHASLLPRHRGAAPIQHAILAGDRETGISIMQMDEGLDSGPVLHRVATPIAPGETAGQLTGRLAELGATALVEALSLIAAGLARPAAAGPLAPRPSRPSSTASTARIGWATGRGVSGAPDPRLRPRAGRLDHARGTRQ